MKLTNHEIYDYLMLKIDKHEGAYFNEEQVSSLFNEAYFDWLKEKADAGERTDKNVMMLGNLIRKKEYGNVDELRLSLIDPPLYRTWALFSNLKFTCKGKTDIYTRPVLPKTWDQMGVAMSNPFESPTNWAPFYTTSSPGGAMVLKIHSESAPEESEIVYIKTPVKMDAENDPDGLIEVSEEAQYEIIDLTLQKMLINTENYNMAQAIGQTEIIKN